MVEVLVLVVLTVTVLVLPDRGQRVVIGLYRGAVTTGIDAVTGGRAATRVVFPLVWGQVLVLPERWCCR